MTGGAAEYKRCRTWAYLNCSCSAEKMDNMALQTTENVIDM
jgi:hypothetical protein